MIVMTLSGNWQ